MRKVYILLITMVLISCTLISCNNESTNNLNETSAETTKEFSEEPAVAEVKTQNNNEEIVDFEKVYTDEYNNFFNTQFDNEIISTKKAIYYDLDSDDIKEMLLFYGYNQVKGDGFIEYSYKIVDIDNGQIISSTYADESGYDIDSGNLELIYISDMGNIIHRRSNLGYSYSVMEYKNNKIQEIENIMYVEKLSEDTEMSFYHWDKQTSKEEYTKIFNEYNIDSIDKIIMGIIDFSGENEYMLYMSSSRQLTNEDIEDFSDEELKIARNEIYARHGYIFNDADLNTYFNSKSWYAGTTNRTDFDSGIFNKYELANIEFLLKEEEKQSRPPLQGVA